MAHLDIDICVPLVKFSHARGVNADNTIGWNHYAASDLSVTIRSSNAMRGSMSMRIIHGTTTVEEIDVGEYINLAANARALAEQARLSVNIDQLPICGITKGSALALRYRLDDGQIRRIQLRLESPPICQQIVDIFQRRGMEFQQQRPSTAQSATEASRLHTSHLDNRPLTVETRSPHFMQQSDQPRHAPLRPPDMEITSQPHQHAKALVDDAPSSRGSLTMLPPPKFDRDENTCPREVIASPPGSHFIQHQQHGPARAALHTGHGERVRGTSSSSQCDSMHSEVIRDAAQSDMSSSDTSYKSVVGSKMQDLPSGTPIRQAFTAWPSDPADLRVYAGPDTLEHEVPPKRELPFKRPGSRKSESTADSSRPGSSAAPTPSIYDPQAADPQPSLKGGLTPSATSEKTVPVPMKELIFGRKALVEMPKNMKRVSSLLDAPHEIESPPSKSARNTYVSVTHVTADNGDVDPARGPFRLPSPRKDNNLDLYAAQSQEDRYAVLDQFMIENLENPKFTELCADIENCWRRMALGL